MKKYYAGIGSRKTPAVYMNLMRDYARYLETQGYVLRSGGAKGADSAFESGVSHAKNREIFLSNDICDDAHKLAKMYHPAYASLKTQEAKNLMARNGYQILGKDLQTPVRFVLCWTPDGATDHTTLGTGGTGQAIRIAIAHNIPVFNMQRYGNSEVDGAFLDFLDEIE